MPRRFRKLKGGLKPKNERKPYGRGKQHTKVTGCRDRLERVQTGEVPAQARPYIETATNALNKALKEWK